MNSNPDERKIFVDEDWKTKVEAEKAKLQDTKADEATQPAAKPPAGEPKLEFAKDDERLPAPSFEMLISAIAAQTMVALGQFPDPMTNRTVVRLNSAQHHIDMLSMLEEKTRGNLASHEAEMLGNVLHQLRMSFIYVQQQKS